MELPIFTSYLSDVPGRRRPSQRESFLTTLASVEQAHRAGAIANPVYVEVKAAINRALETVISAIRMATLYGHGDLPSEVRTFDYAVETSNLYLHTVPGKLKKAEKLAVDHPYCTTLIAVLRELLPLSVLMEALKGMAVKRQIKPVEERRPGYHPPQVSSEAQRQVVTLLEEITEASYTTLRDGLVSAYANWLQDYLEHADIASANGEILSPKDYYVNERLRQRRMPSYAKLGIVTLTTTTATVKVGQPLVFVRKPDWQALLTAKATQVADDIRNDFVRKNFRKIASIVEAKGNFVKGRVLSNTVDLDGLTGRLQFEFADGSSFEAQNAVVFVVNQYGTQFNRWPLTFHDVKLPGGVPMKLPSEQRMNSIFLGRAAA